MVLTHKGVVVAHQHALASAIAKARVHVEQQQQQLPESTAQSSLLVQALGDMSGQLNRRSIKDRLSPRGREGLTGLPAAFDEAFGRFMAVLSGHGPLESLDNLFDSDLARICSPVVDQYHALKQAEAAYAPYMELTNQVEGSQGIPHDGKDCDINCAECFLDLDEGTWKDLSIEDMEEAAAAAAALSEADSRLTQTVNTANLSHFLDGQLKFLRSRLNHSARSASGNETRGSLELRQGDSGSSCSETESLGDTPETTTPSLAKKMAGWRARLSRRFRKKGKDSKNGETGTGSTTATQQETTESVISTTTNGVEGKETA